jgi:hypothetical protein
VVAKFIQFFRGINTKKDGMGRVPLVYLGSELFEVAPLCRAEEYLFCETADQPVQLREYLDAFACKFVA